MHKDLENLEAEKAALEIAMFELKENVKIKEDKYVKKLAVHEEKTKTTNKLINKSWEKHKAGIRKF